jgi:hypothetical protein
MSTQFTDDLNEIDHTITRGDATTMIERYQTWLNDSVDEEGYLYEHETFNVSAVNELLASTTDAVGLRLYYGMDEDNNIVQVLALVDADGVDINNLILERGQSYPHPPKPTKPTRPS